MKQKFQVGDGVRFKKGVFKDQLAKVKKVLRINGRCKYVVNICNTDSWVVSWSFEFDKATLPITTKDLKRYGLIPKYLIN